MCSHAVLHTYTAILHCTVCAANISLLSIPLRCIFLRKVRGLNWRPFLFYSLWGNRAPPLTRVRGSIKGTVSRDNPCSIFFIDHILLVLLEVLNGEFSLCYSTNRKAHRCRLHRWVWTPRCSLRRGVWTHRCRLHRQVRTPRCSLHRGVQILSVAYTEDSTKNFFPQKITGVGYTGGVWTPRYRLHRGVWTHWCRLHRRVQTPGVDYTGESLVQPSRPVNALKGTVP